MLPWFLNSIKTIFGNIFKSSFVFISSFINSLFSKLKSGSIIQILYFLGFLILIGFVFNFFGTLFYYIFQLGIIFFDAFFFIMKFLGYHNFTMGLFLVLFGGYFIISIIKFFKSLFS